MLNSKKNLVFQGGSVKGIAYLGAVSALKDLNYLNFDCIQRVAGTSAGAMTALALALNYSTEEFTKILSVDVQVFLDDSKSRVSRKTLLNLKDAVMTNPAQPNRLPFVAPAILMDLRDNLGLFPGKEVRDWLEQLIFEKTNIRNCTFEELHDLTLKKPELRFKDIYVVGFNLNTNSATTFCWDRTPKAIIADSVRISMGIPFLFSPYQYFVKNEEGLPVLAEGYENDLWIDGGIAENYPVKIFDGIETNMDTLGFYLATPEEMSLIGGLEAPTSTHRVEIAGFWDYSMAVLESALCVNQQLIQHVRGADRCRTIYIDTLGIGTLDFNITVDQKNSLIESGWNAAVKFVEDMKHENEDATSAKSKHEDSGKPTETKVQKTSSPKRHCPIQIPKEATVDIDDSKSSCIIS